MNRLTGRLPGPLRHWWALLGLSVVVVFALVQLVPYRVDNPPVKAEPTWDSPRTRQLAGWPASTATATRPTPTWWEDVAPVSWWITNHVKEGRDALNFSEWGTARRGSDDAIETIRNGSMPPSYYTWLGMHGDAKLSAKERQELIDGLRRTFANSSGTGSGGGG